MEQERLEGWIMQEVERGTPLPGLYPPNQENKARYKAWTEGEGAAAKCSGRQRAPAPSLRRTRGQLPPARREAMPN
ncbi:hypothetical protein UB46_13010 [Burkholderiaceae bacterium 16]|nr:hypothetical protein UB46_13010 [Burkholderiaceae bacterium 16]